MSCIAMASRSVWSRIRTEVVTGLRVAGLEEVAYSSLLRHPSRLRNRISVLMTPNYPKPNVFEREAPRGGEYYAVDLSDGRQMELLRKKGDQRVWLGRPDN